ncbi:MAG: phage minor head protein [Sphingomonadaceae bacterium]
MADALTILEAIRLPPDDAQRAFRAREDLRPSVSWRDFEPEEHARAWTAAKIARLEILETMKTSLDRALAEGKSFEQWKAEVEPELRRAGWWGVVQDRSLTGTDDPVFVGERRLRTIFATNMRVSRAAGQWQRIQARKDSAPYLRYSAILDRRTRPAHGAWHGVVLPVDHAAWEQIFPPNGWNCRCQVQQLSQRDLERRGLGVTPDDQLPARDTIGREWFGRPRRVRGVTRGIDAGWNYNPGAASLDGLVDRAVDVLARAEKVGLAKPAQLTVGELLELLVPVLGRALAIAMLGRVA